MKNQARARNIRLLIDGFLFANGSSTKSVCGRGARSRGSGTSGATSCSYRSFRGGFACRHLTSGSIARGQPPTAWPINSLGRNQHMTKGRRHGDKVRGDCSPAWLPEDVLQQSGAAEHKHYQSLLAAVVHRNVLLTQDPANGRASHFSEEGGLQPSWDERTNFLVRRKQQGRLRTPSAKSWCGTSSCFF
jgi:hypothetical protein